MRNVLGSTCHTKHSMFNKILREHNNGQYLKFVKPSECWMIGEIIACLHLVWLKPTLQAVTTSTEFLTLKQHREFAMVLSKETVWNYLFAIACAFYPIMRMSISLTVVPQVWTSWNTKSTNLTAFSKNTSQRMILYMQQVSHNRWFDLWDQGHCTATEEVEDDR